jgi:hypothetical protein
MPRSGDPAHGAGTTTSSSDSKIRVGVRRVDAAACRFPQENDALCDFRDTHIHSDFALDRAFRGNIDSPKRGMAFLSRLEYTSPIRIIKTDVPDLVLPGSGITGRAKANDHLSDGSIPWEG